MAGPAFFTDPRVVASSLGFAAGQAPWAASITAETDIVRAVGAARGAGASAIKLYAALDAAAVSRIADEARRQNVRLVAHATVFPAKPSDLVAAGVNVLAHAAYLVWEGSPPTPDYTQRAKGDVARVAPDSAPIERVLAAMRDRGVALNPTLWVFADGPGGRDELKTERTRWMNAVTRRAAELGVPRAAGTDGLIDGRAVVLHRELELEVAAGLTPMQAIVSATGGAARAVGVEKDRGTIERGKIADLVIVNADPLADVGNLRNIDTVIFDGKVADRAFHSYYSTPFLGSVDDIRVVEALPYTVSLKAATFRGGITNARQPTNPVESPQPAIQTISPVVAKEGDQTINLKLTGFNFVRGSRVLFDGVSVPWRFVSPTELNVTLSPDLLKRPGRYDIVVINPQPMALPDWGNGTSNKAHFLVDFKYDK